MGTLPGNFIANSDLANLPVGRFAQMFRDETFPDTGGFSPNPPNTSDPWYATTPFTFWDAAQTDYGNTYARGSSVSGGSSPYFTATPSPDMYWITVAANERPVPFLAWFDVFCYIGNTSGEMRNRFGLMQRSRDRADDPSFYRALATAEYFGEWETYGARTFSGTGMGVVPPYQTHEVFVGWDQGDVSGTYTGAPIYQDSGGEDWARRNFFGVLTF